MIISESYISINGKYYKKEGKVAYVFDESKMKSKRISHSTYNKVLRKTKKVKKHIRSTIKIVPDVVNIKIRELDKVYVTAKIGRYQLIVSYDNGELT